MAYSSVGRPRFIVDYIQLFRVLGLDRDVHENSSAHYFYNLGSGATDPDNADGTGFGMKNMPLVTCLDPSIDAYATGFGGVSASTYGWNWDMRMHDSFPVKKLNIVGLFGHQMVSHGDAGINFGTDANLSMDDGTTSTAYPRVKPTDGTGANDLRINVSGFSSDGYQIHAGADGWTLCSVDGDTYGAQEGHLLKRITPHIRKIDNAYSATRMKIPTILWGYNYTMPISASFDLSMERVMDGVDRTRSLGGSEIFDHKYIKKPDWSKTYVPRYSTVPVEGATPAWDFKSGAIAPPNPLFAMKGRRKWNLSFTMRAEDYYPEVSNLSNYGALKEDGTPYGTTNYLNEKDHALYSPLDESFYGDVINATLGNQLRFIFQPDSNDTNQFAFCKFKNDSFNARTVGNGIIEIDLTIEEVW